MSAPRPQLHIGIEADRVVVERAGRSAIEHAVFAGMAREDGVSAALALALDEAFETKPVFRPRTRIVIRDGSARAGVLRFETWPRRAAERRALVTHRFCRENRLVPADTAVAFEAAMSSDGAIVLAEALPRSLVTNIGEALGARRLHPDWLVSDLTLAASQHSSAGPGAIVAANAAGVRVLLTDRDGAPESVLSLTPGMDLAARLAARLRRHALRHDVPVEALALRITGDAALEADIARLRETNADIAPTLGKAA